jgi:hypothetical protein
MFQSHIIEVSGTFIGAAVPTFGKYRFHAVHPQVSDLDGSSWPSLDELKRAAGCLYRTGRLISTDAHASAASNVVLPQQGASENAPTQAPPGPTIRLSLAAPWTPR